MVGGGLDESGAGLPPVRYGRKIALTEEERRELVTPPAQASPVEHKGRLWPIAVIIVAIAVVAAIMGYRSLVPDDGSSPEDAFRGFAEAMNEGNASKAIEFTVDAFIDDALKVAEVEDMEAIWAEDGKMSITIHSIDVTYHHDMDSFMREQVDEVVDQVESLWHVSVSDSCALSFSITASQGGVVNDKYGSIVVVKIGSSWYLAPGALY